MSLHTSVKWVGEPSCIELVTGPLGLESETGTALACQPVGCRTGAATLRCDTEPARLLHAQAARLCCAGRRFGCRRSTRRMTQTSSSRCREPPPLRMPQTMPCGAILCSDLTGSLVAFGRHASSMGTIMQTSANNIQQTPNPHHRMVYRSVPTASPGRTQTRRTATTTTSSWAAALRAACWPTGCRRTPTSGCWYSR